MTELERGKEMLAELNKLIAAAEHPGAYVNSLAEERRSLELSIKLMERLP